MISTNENYQALFINIIRKTINQVSRTLLDEWKTILISVNQGINKLYQLFNFVDHIIIVSDFLSLVGIGITAFVTTKIDYIFVLMVFFSHPRYQPYNVIFGHDDLVFNVMFSVDESREIVKNYLAELHISDGSNESLIGNLQSAQYPRVLQGHRKDKRDL